MKIDNPFQLNDWEIKKFLKVILVLQFALWGVIGLDATGLQIPILRQLIGFIYLTFVPGIILLRILKLHKLGNVETLLYTVGLSIATLMFTGLLMNTVYPAFGIPGPISLTPLISTISTVMLILCILSYVRDKKFSNPNYIDVRDLLSPPALFLCLLPFLAIFGTYLVNFYHNNILLMLLIIVIVFIVVLIAFDKFISMKLYPLAISVISIALLYHRALISPYLLGPDVRYECVLCQLVVSNSHWDSTLLSTPANAMLSVTILPAIYSIISSIDAHWAFKIIYPTIFSIVPLGLYHIFQKQTDEKTAFLSAFFFMAFQWFILIMNTTKQATAELFLVLLLLLIVNKEMNSLKSVALSIIFSTSMIVSHYGTSYIYMLYLPFVLLLVMHFARGTGNAKIKTTRTYVVLYFVTALSWYIYVSNAATFETIVHIGDHMYNSIFTDFFSKEARDPTLSHFLGLEAAPSLWRMIGYRIYQVTQFFIFVGVVNLLLKHRETKFNQEYRVYTFISMFILFWVIVLPFFATNISTSRIYHLSLFFLSPFCIIGGETVLKGLLRVFKSKSISIALNRHVLSILVLVVLIPYFLFSTGFVFEIVGDAPSSVSLGLKRMKQSNDANVTVALNHQYVWEQDVAGAKWLGKNKNDNAAVWRDYEASTILSCYGMIILHQRTLSKTTSIQLIKDNYVYLRYMNIVNGVMIEPLPKYRSGVYNKYNTREINYLFKEKSRIYDNGGSEIYK